MRQCSLNPIEVQFKQIFRIKNSSVPKSFQSYHSSIQTTIDERIQYRPPNFQSYHSSIQTPQLHARLRCHKFVTATSDHVDNLFEYDEVSSEKRMSIDIYDILVENKYPDKKMEGVTQKIIDLAKRHL
jgi:hypothetical protein